MANLTQTINQVINKNNPEKGLNIKNLRSPAFLMNAPFSLSATAPNNVWMKETPPEKKKINVNQAFNEWLDLYTYLSSMSLVYILPTVKGLQDQTYVANLGIILPHLNNEIVIISNFKSPPRIDEAKIGLDFFNLMGYKVVQSPPYFEGEADLKYIKDNIYIGAYGIRTNLYALNWFTQKYNMNIIKLRMQDEYLYHIDCLVFPLANDKIMLAVDLIDQSTVKEIEKIADVIPVDKKDAYCGITNCVRCSGVILCCSTINSMKATDEYYQDETHKIASLEKICAENSLELVFFNLNEGTKSGAMLSCNIMHLTRPNY